MTAAANDPPPEQILRVGMVLYSALTFDSRVQREANALAAAGHHVTIFCLEGSHETAPMLDRRVRVVVLREGGRQWSPEKGNPFVTASGVGRHIARLRFLAKYAQNLRTWGRGIARQSAGFDVWHAHDFTGLVAASLARRHGEALVYDLHDLFLDTRAGARLPALGRTLLLRYERRLARRADLLVTVNHGVADWAHLNLRPRSIAVVHNCVPRTPPFEPRPTHIGDALGLAPGARVALYHGSLGENCGLEQMYEAMLLPGLDQAHLVLLGFGPDRDRLQASANETQFGGRIHLLEPVPPGELLGWVASADVGVMPIQPHTLTGRLSTPNKLFESLAAGIPVVASDFAGQRRIIMDDPLGPLGAVCDPTKPVAIADAIRSVLNLDVAAYDELRQRCSVAAQLRWNWEREAATLVDAYRRIARDGRDDA